MLIRTPPRKIRFFFLLLPGNRVRFGSNHRDNFFLRSHCCHCLTLALIPLHIGVRMPGRGGGRLDLNSGTEHFPFAAGWDPAAKRRALYPVLIHLPPKGHAQLRKTLKS